VQRAKLHAVSANFQRAHSPTRPHPIYRFAPRVYMLSLKFWVLEFWVLKFEFRLH